MASLQDPDWLVHGDCCSLGVATASHAKAAPVPEPDVCADKRWAFIVGAPRCGTTSMSRYIGDHPDVCFSAPKESHFFALADLSALPDHILRHRIRNDYLDRFFPDRNGAPVMAEGSVTYLYVPEQLDPIVRLWPQAKFVIGVRNPLTMLPSLHRRLCFIGDETVRDFAQAWELVPERRQGRSIPRTCAHPRWLDYWEAGLLGKYVGQFLEHFGPERCFVYLYEDFAADPAAVHRQILKFLDLDDDGRRDYPAHRDSRDFRIGWVQRTVMRPPPALLMLAGVGYRRILAPGPEPELGPVGKAALAARERILAWNRAPAPPVRLEPKLRSEMAAMFADDVAHLGALIGRDLSHWLAN